MPIRLKKYPKKSPNWYIRGTVEGTGIELNESTGTADEKQASLIRNTREREILDGCDAIRQAQTFADAINQYLDLGRSDRFLSPLLAHFKDKPLSDIGQSEIDACARLLLPHCKPATRRRNVYVPMKAILNEASKAGLCDYKRISSPIFAQPIIRAASQDHINKLIERASPRLKAFINFITYTGARTGEALALEISDLDLPRGEAYLRHTKNGDPRLVVLATPVIEAIMDMPADPPHPRVFKMRWVKTVQDDLALAEKAAKLPHQTFHQMGRHRFAERLLAMGHTIKEVKEAGGWKSIDVVDRNYGHLERSRVHDIVRDAAEADQTETVKKRA